MNHPPLRVPPGNVRTAVSSRKHCPQPKSVYSPDLHQFVRVRCDSWECPHCGRWKAQVTARMLHRDAGRAHRAPTHVVTLTTNDPATTSEAYVRASRRLFKRLRRLYGRVEYFGMIEFTTGTGERSGGHRRLHGHYLLKFLDLEHVDDAEVERIVREVWRDALGAYVVEVAPLKFGEAAINYLGLHHQKRRQAPPAGWRGMRHRPSRGYFDRPVAELRELAALELHLEARAHRAGRSPLEQLEHELPAASKSLADERTLAAPDWPPRESNGENPARPPFELPAGRPAPYGVPAAWLLTPAALAPAAGAPRGD